jgi:hypothetical protein
MRSLSRVHVIISAAVLAVFVTEAWGIEQRVQLDTTTGTLQGTLDLPNGTSPCPVVVIVAGSGPTDRDGNQALMKNDSLKLLGQALAVRGIAALRYDNVGSQRARLLHPRRRTSVLKRTSPMWSSGSPGYVRIAVSCVSGSSVTVRGR